jgi:hypothetical protein
MMRPWTVREALEAVLLRLTLLEVDPRLVASQRALVGELRQADQQALNVLRADNTIQPGQRNARAQQIEDKVFAAEVIERAHTDLGVDELYNARDLSQDAAVAIRAGLASFTSDLGDF